MLSICQSVKLRNGQRFNKTVIVGMFHTLDNWTCHGETDRHVRSLRCLKAVPANGMSFTCRVCQQHGNDDTENTDKHADDNVLNNETTEQSIKSIFPSAPSQMINFLLAQAKTCGLRSNRMKLVKGMFYYMSPTKQSQSKILRTPTIQ